MNVERDDPESTNAEFFLTAKPGGCRRMFTSFLEARRFVCYVTLVEAARRTPDDSANYSIEVKRKNYP